MSSQFGQLFRIATYGESHGGVVGVVIDTMRQIEAQLVMRNYEGFMS